MGTNPAGFSKWPKLDLLQYLVNGGFAEAGAEFLLKDGPKQFRPDALSKSVITDDTLPIAQKESHRTDQSSTNPETKATPLARRNATNKGSAQMINRKHDNGQP